MLSALHAQVRIFFNNALVNRFRDAMSLETAACSTSCMKWSYGQFYSLADGLRSSTVHPIDINHSTFFLCMQYLNIHIPIIFVRDLC
jgi:hypothetical protein